MHHHDRFRPFAPLPPVYPFHDRRRRDRFLELVRDHLGRGGRKVIIEAGVARVEGDNMLHGLTNLAQMCHQSPPETWPRIVAEHLEKSDRGRLEATALGLMASSFEQVAGQLAVRMHAEHYLPIDRRQHIVHRVDLQGTISVLVIDIGPSMLAVPTPIAEQWGVPVDELFERALENIVRANRGQWSTLALPPSGVAILDALDGDCYATSHVLRRDAFLPRTGAHGNLIALPTRGSLLSYPLDVPLKLRAIEELLMFTTWAFHEGPNSITPHLYWRTPDARLLLQQGSNERGRVRFAPSPEFVELMMRLQGPAPRREENCGDGSHCDSPENP